MRGIYLLGGFDPVISGRARMAGLEVVDGERPELLWNKTLVVRAGTRVPFHLLPAAWGLLERWDAAVPLWRYYQTAEQVGTKEELEATRALIRDTRVLLHATELLFVRRNEAGQALVTAWLEEMEGGGEARLAFLRAHYRVKPRLCVLPTSWLVAATHVTANGVTRPAKRGNLVQVELEPGRYVKVHAGDEARARAMFARQRKGRR